jgi:excisionase family DNA binding protein
VSAKSTSVPTDRSPQFRTRYRAAKIIDSSPQLLDKLIRQGKLRGYRVGRKVLVREDELLALVAEGEIR